MTEEASISNPLPFSLPTAIEIVVRSWQVERHGGHNLPSQLVLIMWSHSESILSSLYSTTSYRVYK